VAGVRPNNGPKNFRVPGGKWTFTMEEGTYTMSDGTTGPITTRPIEYDLPDIQRDVPPPPPGYPDKYMA